MLLWGRASSLLARNSSRWMVETSVSADERNQVYKMELSGRSERSMRSDLKCSPVGCGGCEPWDETVVANDRSGNRADVGQTRCSAQVRWQNVDVLDDHTMKGSNLRFGVESW